MPYQDFPDGLYLAQQKSNIKPYFFDHYGVIDVGNILNHPQGNPNMPIVIHQANPAIRADGLTNTPSWKVMGKVNDAHLINAKKRLQEALKNPEYNLICNNCEHFARYVTTGIKESTQIQSAFAITVLGVLLYSLWNME